MSGDNDVMPKVDTAPKVDPAPIVPPPQAISVMPVTNATSIRASGSEEKQCDDN